MHHALAAARNPELETIASLADGIAFLNSFLVANIFADDRHAALLRRQLDAAAKAGHSEAQYSRMRERYEATTRGNLEHWRNRLFEAREELLRRGGQWH